MEEQTKQKRIFELFSDISSQMSFISELDQLITFFVSKIAEIFKAERVSLMLLDRTKQELSIKASYGLNPPTNSTRIKLGEMFGGWVAQQGSPLLVKDVETEFPDVLKDRLPHYQTKSFVIVPIKVNSARRNIYNGEKDRVIGILSLTDRKNSGVFTKDDLKIIIFFCHCLALHIENIDLLDNPDLLTVDILTSLFNHRYFQEELTEEIYRAERYRHPLSLLILDIDNFRDYNQTYGYSAGDSALKQIGRVIKENTRRVDLAARYGPEEFTVILPDTRLKQAIFVGEKIKQAIGDSVFAEDRASSLGMGRLTVSVGVTGHKIGLSKDELIQRGSKALLEAKQKGRNRICVFK